MTNHMPDAVKKADKQRAAFEAWASDNGAYPACIERSGDGYKLMDTQQKWGAWRAADCIQQSRHTLQAKAEANARLIAAAPDLLAALVLARNEVAYMASGMTHAGWKTMEAQKALSVIDAAIQKATKEQV